MPKWNFIGKDGQPTSPPPIVLGDGSDGVWYPLIPFGSFVTPKGDYFDVTPTHAQEMVAQFQQGLPNGTGIPVDENQAHQKNPDGAYAWITDLDVREDGLWGYVKPTSEGLKHLDALPLVSPHFTVGEAESPNYPGRRNFLEAAALCSSPWFHGQPGMERGTGATVMASMSTVGEEPAATAAHSDDAGGAIMASIEELQAQIDTLTADKAALEAVVAERDAALAENATAIEALQADVTARDERITELEAAQTAATTAAEEMSTRITALEDAARMRDIVNELENTIIGEGDDAKVYAPEAVEVMAALQLTPGPEASTAFMAHVKAHGGQPAMLPASTKPALRPIQASLETPPELTDDDKLASLPEADARRIRGIMGEHSCGYEQARRMDFQGRR